MDAYDKDYGLETGIAGVFMDPKEMPRNSSLYSARFREYHELKISRWYPNFLDYLALPAYLIEETRDEAKAALEREGTESERVAAAVQNALNGNNK